MTGSNGGRGGRSRVRGVSSSRATPARRRAARRGRASREDFTTFGF